MKLIDFVDRIAAASSESQANMTLRDYLASYDIHSYAFTYYSRHIKTGQKLQFHCVSEALQPWHQYYLEQGYADVDRTLERVITTTLPIKWNVHTQLAHAKNKRERRIRLESIKFGIDQGVSIPVHGPDNDFANLTLHQRQGECWFKNYSLLQYEWMNVAQLFYHYIKKILGSNIERTSLVSTKKLTRREEQCLLFTAKLWRVEQIAEELKISPRTVNFHLQNANKKMGTNNKYQTIFKYF